jgi:hypothetical protein
MERAVMASSGRRRRLTTIVVDERNAWSRSIDQDRSNGKMTFLKTSKDILINGTSSWHHIRTCYVRGWHRQAGGMARDG